MKKALLALSALAAFTGSALAADLPARTYSKAPAVVAVAPSWTGFYVFGGLGGGLWSADGNQVVGALNALGAPNATAGTALTRDVRTGGSGWFGTIGAGYDWQFNGSWVAGVFADGQFGSLSGSIIDPFFVGSPEGREKLRNSWAAGVRLGYLVAPNVNSYLNAGYTGSTWSGANLTPPDPTILNGRITTPGFTRNGFFVGGGVENNLNIFGISAPGWFMKTEYRSAYYSRVTLQETVTGPNIPTGVADTFKPWVQTISTSLVYRFNWGGSVVAKY